MFAFTNNGEVWQIPINVAGNNHGDLGIPQQIVDPGANPLNTLDAAGNPIAINGHFVAVTNGPANYRDESGNSVEDLLFGVTNTGEMFALDPATLGGAAGTIHAREVFQGDVERVSLNGGGGFVGLYFSPLDRNLWHLSNAAAGEAKDRLQIV